MDNWNCQNELVLNVGFTDRRSIKLGRVGVQIVFVFENNIQTETCFKKESFFFAISLRQKNGNCFLPALHIVEKRIGTFLVVLRYLHYESLELTFP